MRAREIQFFTDFIQHPAAAHLTQLPHVTCNSFLACTMYRVVLKYCILDWGRISEFVSFKKTSARKLSKHSVCIITHICYYILVNISVLILISVFLFEKCSHL